MLGANLTLNVHDSITAMTCCFWDIWILTREYSNPLQAVWCEPSRCVIIRSSIYYYHLKTQHKYQQYRRLLLICSLFIHHTTLVETSLTACATRELDLVLTATDSDLYKPLMHCKNNTIHHCYIQSDTHWTILIVRILLNYKLLYSFIILHTIMAWY